MNKIRIKESIELYNFRKRVENARLEKKLNEGKMTASGLASKMYGQTHSRRYGSLLSNGKFKSIKFDQIQIICDTLGVDPNFLFGFESKHDKDYLDNLTF